MKAQTGPRVNRQIRAPEVRVIDEENNQLGVLPLAEALELAQSRGLDLVEVAANQVPPVCRLVDFGRFKYEQTKREREAKKHQHATEIKELRLRPKTDAHDLEVRARAARKFLEEGHKVRLLVRFRGRETQHPDIARSQIDAIARAVSDVGFMEQGPAFEGRAMFAVLAKGSAPRGQARPAASAATAAVRAPAAPAAPPPRPSGPDSSTP